MGRPVVKDYSTRATKTKKILPTESLFLPVSAQVLCGGIMVKIMFLPQEQKHELDMLIYAYVLEM